MRKLGRQTNPICKIQMHRSILSIWQSSDWFRFGYSLEANWFLMFVHRQIKFNAPVSRFKYLFAIRTPYQVCHVSTSTHLKDKWILALVGVVRERSRALLVLPMNACMRHLDIHFGNSWIFRKPKGERMFMFTYIFDWLVVGFRHATSACVKT